MREIKWDKHNGAILAEHIDTRGEDPARHLEFTRVQPRSLSDNPPDLPPYYNLAIVTEGEEMSFSQMTAREVCRVAEAMIRLVGGTMQVRKEVIIEPPHDWETKP